MKNSCRKVISTLGLTTALAGLTSVPALADQVILDDLIVEGSACIGVDCVNGESFGFDTIRLKENNLRIKFQDTSNSASFPSNDWQLTANDSTNGGSNKFSIDDVDSGRTPFTIEAGARANALFVEADSDVGIGTATPVVDLHIVTGNTPTLRLDQDGSNGFTPQIWDLAGNEANFFVRDVTNGSALPLKIKPGAPTSAIFVAASGNIGLNTESPDTKLHLRSAGASNVRFEDSVGAVEWETGLAANDTFKVSAVDTSGVQFRYTRDGSFIMQGQDSPPTAFVSNGALYYDTSGALCIRVGGSWQAVFAQGAATCS